MKNRDEIDIEASLTELSDEEAVAIMEGRQPATDSAAINDAATALARKLIAEQVDSAREPDAAEGGGRVIELISRQPWMRMAAAVVLGVILGTLVRAPIQPGEVSPEPGVASTNVVYLETSRSADPGDVQRVKIHDNEPWITLIAYPDFEGAKRLRLEVERATGQDGRAPATVPVGKWEGVLSTTVGRGTEDSVAVTIDTQLLQSGYYRLKIISDMGSRGSFETSHVFLVMR